MKYLSDIFAYLWPPTEPVPAVTGVETEDNELISALSKLYEDCMKIRDEPSSILTRPPFGSDPYPEGYSKLGCAGCVILQEARARLSGFNGHGIVLDRHVIDGDQVQWLMLQQSSRSMLIMARDGRSIVLALLKPESLRH
ncbi:MAG: hypothetical protein JWP58_4589 [Hymenobacter sp.]|jgi:hypothetical protein|nr:hypothetical protein [Hymenobacter sp.]